MAIARQGLAFYPGIRQVVSASYTLSHGISPGIATLELAPQPDFTPQSGTLEFRFGNVRLTFPDCRLQQQQRKVGPSGWTWQLSLLDRRWKWAFGAISGHYNWRDASGEVFGSLAKSPRELCALCLDAMGERGYDLRLVPDNARPAVDWEMVNPAQALAELADQLGCRVVLQVNNTVAIIPAGLGNELHLDHTVIDDSLAIDPPEHPDAIEFVCGPTRFQTDFPLVAVGLDTDFEIKPIDELSYTPSTGWLNVAPPGFQDVASGDARELAKQTVFRWYGIRSDIDREGREGMHVPGYGPIQFLEQIVPIEDEQVESAVQGEETVSKPAEIFGVFYAGQGNYANESSGTKYTKDFRINSRDGIVELSDYCWRYDDDRKRAQAQLYLRCAFRIRDPDTWGFVRHVIRRELPGRKFGTKPRILRHDEIQLTKYPVWQGDTLAPEDLVDSVSLLQRVVTNEQRVKQEAEQYLRAVLFDYQLKLPREVAYAGLVPISPDGAIQQVTWNVGPGGATTRAGRNNEFSQVVPSYAERRQYEKLRHNRVVEMHKAQEALDRKKRGKGARTG